MPKTTGGFNIIDIALWNKAAVCKHYWELCREKNKLWIQWIHNYYIKGKEVWGIQVKQASWMIGKILKAQETLVKAGFNHEKIRRTKKCNIKTIYHRLRGTFDKVRWKKIACQNLGCPRCTFMLTLTAHGKLYTRDRLQKWGMHVEEDWVLCRTEKESIQHLFFECEYSKALWSRILVWQGMNRGVLGWEQELA